MQGQKLISIENRTDQEYHSTKVESLKQKIKIIKLLTENKKTEFNSNTRIIKKRIKSLKLELALMLLTIPNLEKEVEIRSSEVESSQTLTENNLISKVSMERLNLKRLESLNKLNQFKIELSNRRLNLVELEESINTEAAYLKRFLLNSETKELDLKESINEIKRDSINVITASQDGVINNLQFKENIEINSTKPLFSIIPVNSELRGELIIPSRLIPYIKETDELKVEFEAFSKEKYGSFTGIVTSVSKTLMSKNESNNPISGPIGLFHKVSITFPDTNYQKLRTEFKLNSGLKITAYIKRGDYSLYNWIQNANDWLSTRINS